ncbi:MAG: histidinol-phosphate transaminase [Cyanobacteria bacterium NC_groundwater_1444_Ag_S-0.65um_54_12]|nr:histidinol-phosphate transaminase [Cyanobacteria bacterium NC_groundwater_1444_Ag_S-0.65um_54_12]
MLTSSFPCVAEHIARLTPYQPGKTSEEVKREFGLERVIKLACNENPFGPSPMAKAAAMQALQEAHYYPDSAGYALRRALSQNYRVKFENIIIGAGSEGILASIVRAYLNGNDEALTSDGTFIGFTVLIRSQGIPLRCVPLRNYAYDLVAMARAITPRTKLIYLANPNNPTGTLIDRAAFEDFYSKVPGHILLIMDEAYHEFVGSEPAYPDSQLYRHDNVFTLRTFSKAYGLAGLRIGYGIAHETIIEQLLKIKLPFEPNHIAQAAALAAFADREFVKRTIASNVKGLETLYDGLARLGMVHVRSFGNFVMIDLGSSKRVQWFSRRLLERGIIIRPLAAFGLPDCLRITVGLPEENELLLSELANLLKQESVV